MNTANQSNTDASSDASVERQQPGSLESLTQALFSALASAPSRPRELRAETKTAPPTLRLSEAKYRTLIELLPAVTFLASFDEGLSDVYVSPQIETLLGYSQEEWLADPVLWYQRLHPDDRDRWNHEFAKTVAAGEPLQSAYRFLARNGRVVWIHTQARIVRDEAGKPSFIHGIGVDITQMKEAEQKTQEYAERLQRTNLELEQFAYVASHDLQEPLRSILSFSDMLVTDYGDNLDSQAKRHLERLQEAGKRMKSLIQALLEFSRVGRMNLPMHPTDLTSVVQEVIGNLNAAIQENGATVTHDSLPTVVAVRTDMIALFQNLIGNAIKFRSAEPLRVDITCKRDKDGWVFSVRDNGIGIDPQYHSKVFEIFKRLHDQKKYAGTGIGLALCKKVVDLHGGRIWVESERGKGAAFKFTLPATKGTGNER